MCGSMVDIQSATARKKEEEEEEDRRNHRAKIKCPHLLRRAAINRLHHCLERHALVTLVYSTLDSVVTTV